ncbi:TonB-dependent receptor domain-containing protein [Moraxella sp. ZY210820]|uniref:TonB-dependent receptor domain-containing protein n=1 Tax=unclassified Moraxella TaxID=2685852 RepID=UPI00272FAC4F|nr:TonB-dependent receptor [Moraxella sp. ZY210820]WLF83863.1 TonB-dependent receptor [Moraxella sp. ZY210820]
MKKILFKLSLLTSAILSCSVAMAQQTVETKQVLPTIEVTAQQGTKYKTNVVTTEVKNESTETDLRGLLKEEPAIEISGGNGTSQYYAIRGMGQNSIDVKVDNTYSDSQILYHQGRFMLDPSLVKIVEVQKGAGSASAGIGATNGAIIAKTVDALDLLENSDKDYGFKIHGGYNSNDGHNYGATAFAKAGNFDFLLSANRIDEDDYKGGKGYKNSSNSDVVTNSALDKIGGLAKIGVTAGNHRFVISHMHEQHEGDRGIRQEFDMAETRLAVASLNGRQRAAGLRLAEATGRKDNQGRDTFYVVRANGQPVLQNEASDTKITQQTTNLEWTATDLGLVDKATANVYFMEKERKSADDTANGYAGNVPGATVTTIKTKGANVNFDWKVADDTILKTGVNYRHQEISPHEFNQNIRNLDNTGTITLSNPEKTDTGAYVEVISEIADTVTLTGGLRYDHFKFKAMDGKTVSSDDINPSIAIKWTPIQGLSLNANHHYATRSPRMYDALLTHGYRGITTIADGTTAERAKNTEVGINYTHTFANDSTLSANASYFWQRIDDAVINPQDRHTTADRTTIREIENAGYITNKGFEIDFTYRINGLTVKAGMADSDPVFHAVKQSNNNDMNPEFGAKVGRTWTSSIAYRFNQPNLELGVRNRTAEKSDKSLREGIITAQRDGYSVTDIFANWKPLANDRLNVNFAINNITDDNYRLHSQRANAGLPATGRDFRVGFNYTF